MNKNFVNNKGRLDFAGHDVLDLAEKYGTPLYVYDVSLIRRRAREFINAFNELGLQSQVAYASKAFSCVAMIQLAKEEDLSLDVVSGGELFTALRAGFPMERVHFHGNNKSESELRMALAFKVGCIVVDNFHELFLLEKLSEELRQTVSILLRVSPGVEAHTHEYITTGQYDSKFGFNLHDGQARSALRKALKISNFNVLGLHSHIGSQIFETSGFIHAVEKLFSKMVEWKSEFNYFPQVINLGGGFGISYTEEDKPLEMSSYVEAIGAKVLELSNENGVIVPEIWIEPGRSLVGDAGITLYEAGSEKIIPNTRHYISVDGGMSDNIRPALYQAKYTALLVSRPNDISTNIYSIAGKCCESGDVLIKDIMLPKVRSGDIIAILSTGAYGYSMASNYNRLPKPAVVFVEEGVDKLVVRRESYEDLVRNDLDFVADERGITPDGAKLEVFR